MPTNARALQYDGLAMLIDDVSSIDFEHPRDRREGGGRDVNW